MSEPSHGAGADEVGRPLRVLFLCVQNSARSIIAEALMRQLGGDGLDVSSAGAQQPKGVNPLTLRVLEEAGVPTDGLRSKSLDEFRGQQFDYVITVCDEAREACPYFPDAHRMLHWNHEDPAAAEGTEEQRLIAFRKVLHALDAQVRGLVSQAASNSVG